LKTLIKSINEIYNDLVKGRGPDKKKRKSKGKKLPEMSHYEKITYDLIGPKQKQIFLEALRQYDKLDGKYYYSGDPRREKFEKVKKTINSLTRQAAKKYEETL
jgi:hypothetical protein